MSSTKNIAVDDKLAELIRETVRESMQAFGSRDVYVRAGEDHEGDPVLFIEADYDLTDTPIDTADVGIDDQATGRAVGSR